TITENFTTNVTALTTFSRAYPTGADYLNEILGELDDALGVTLNPRAGCAKHMVFFSDAVYTDDIQSRITPFSNRNILANSWIISAVKYRDVYDDSTDAIAKWASIASPGGSYLGATYVNNGDPDGYLNKPRRLYIKNSFDSNPVPGLVAGITQNTCQLTGFASGCITGSVSYSWAASSGGSIVSGGSSQTVTTNGTGTYTLTVTANGCNKQAVFTY